MPRILYANDMLLRLLEPDQWDETGPLAVGFEDRAKPYESLSFYVETMTTPAQVMRSIAQYGRAKALCKTGKRPPTPEAMYSHGYRLSRTPAGLVLAMVKETASIKLDKQISIKKEGDGDIRNDGHLNLRNGKAYSQTLAANSSLLSMSETFPPEPEKS